MKRETLFEEIGKLDAALLDENVAQAPKNRRPLLWGTLAACLVLCVGVGAIWLHQPQQPDVPTANLPDTTQPTELPTETTTATEPITQLTMPIPDISEMPVLLASPAYVPALLRFTQPMQERLAHALQAGTWEELPADTVSADGECKILFVHQPDAPFRLVFYPDCTVEYETANGTKKYRISEEMYTAVREAMQPEDPLPLLVTYEMEQITRTGVWEHQPDFHTASLAALEDLEEGMHYRLIRDTCQAEEYRNLPEAALPLLTIKQAVFSAEPDYVSLAYPAEGTALSGSWTKEENGNFQFSLDGGGSLQFQPIGEYTLQLVKMEDVPEAAQALEGTSFTACVDSWQPFAEIRAADLRECTVSVGPYPKKVPMTAEECAMLATLLQEVRIVQRDQTGIVYYGGPIFGNLTLQDGTEIRIAADRNRFFVNDRWFFVDDDGATNAVQNLLDEVYD